MTYTARLYGSAPAAFRPSVRSAWLLAICLALHPVTALAAPGAPDGEEHASHHPGGADGAGASAKSPGMAGGMSGMGKMMERMGVPPPTELYPSLMALPDLPLEKRAEVQRRAKERMKSGEALMDEAIDSLSDAARTDDYAAMQEAVAHLHESLGQYESGLAAQRALAEGKAPRNVALQWFKNEMNLPPVTGAAPETSLLGGPSFHLVTIAILSAFTVAMLWMYFFKMRRAAALIDRLIAEGSHAVSDSAPADPSPPTHAAAPPKPVPQPAALAAPPMVVPAGPTPAIGGKKDKWSGTLRVARTFDETPEVRTFRLVTPEGGPLPFQYDPGQFLVLTVTPEGQEVKRSYTIASSPTQREYCEITVKREDPGVVSGFLHGSVREGDLLGVAAPSGRFTFSGQESDGIVLIGGGVGITPLMSAVRYLCDSGWGSDIFLLYCCRTSQDFIFREELEYLQRRHANLHVVATMTRAEGTVWMGLKGRFTPAVLEQCVPGLAGRRIHVCGPPPMMTGIRAMLEELGVPENNVHTEAFGPAQRPAAKRALATGCTCERCERRRAEERAPQATSDLPGSPPEGTAPPQVATVRFQASDKAAPLPADETVLDIADELGVEIDNSCRVGSCGTCKVKLVSGSVTMECEDGLEPDEKADGLVLACQAKSNADVVVDA